MVGGKLLYSVQASMGSESSCSAASAASPRTEAGCMPEVASCAASGTGARGARAIAVGDGDDEGGDGSWRASGIGGGKELLG